jgi:hypothetical protein
MDIIEKGETPDATFDGLILRFKCRRCSEPTENGYLGFRPSADMGKPLAPIFRSFCRRCNRRWDWEFDPATWLGVPPQAGPMPSEPLK